MNKLFIINNVIHIQVTHMYIPVQHNSFFLNTFTRTNQSWNIYSMQDHSLINVNISPQTHKTFFITDFFATQLNFKSVLG